MPADTAATWSERIGFCSISRARIHSMQSRSAIQPPVIAAVRVPPSAWMTSQSIRIWRSPSAGEVDDGAERAPDQLAGFPASGQIACRRRLRDGCVRWWRAAACRILPSPSPLPPPAKPRRHLSSRLAVQKHMRVAEADEAGPLRMLGDPAFEGDLPQVRRLLLRRARITGGIVVHAVFIQAMVSAEAKPSLETVVKSPT